MRSERTRGSGNLVIRRTIGGRERFLDRRRVRLLRADGLRQPFVCRVSARLDGLRAVKLITFVSTAAVLMATAATAQAADLSATEAQQLESSLGAQGAGVYVDGGEAVVNVTSEAAAEQVEAAGATAKLVEHSDAELARVNETIKVAGNVPGMSWGTDPVTNQVVVTLDPTVDAAEQAHVEAALASAGDAARIEHTDEAFTPLVAGGEAIYTGSSRCSLGFNVRNAANQNFFLTAGHCTNIGSSSAGPNRALIGSTFGSSFPGNDYGIVRYLAGAAAPTGDVSLYNGQKQDITTARNAVVGESVKRSGLDHRAAHRHGHRDQPDRPLRAGRRLRPHPHQRVRRAG